jgi:hypothetical protein
MHTNITNIPDDWRYYHLKTKNLSTFYSIKTRRKHLPSTVTLKMSAIYGDTEAGVIGGSAGVGGIIGGT